MRNSVFCKSVLAASLFCISSLASAGAPLKDIPLQWLPGFQFNSLGPVELDVNMRSAPIHIEALTDRRTKSASLIGENQENPAKPLPVTTTADVPAFVTAHLVETLRGAGFNIVDTGGDYVFSGELRDFFTAEGEVYRANVVVYGHLKSSKGKEVWHGIVHGRADNFGRSYKVENYYTAYSNAVLDAAYNLTINTCFLSALQKP
jgi:hypothetical protein